MKWLPWIISRRQRIKKVPVFITTLLLFTLVHHCVLQSFGTEGRGDGLASPENDSLRFVICRNIVNFEPFGIANTFVAHENRVYFYTNPGEDYSHIEKRHIWFLAADTIMQIPCPAADSICISSIEPERLRAGLWSVDMVSGNQLLGSAQMEVTNLE
jgi:hypothetical protein